MHTTCTVPFRFGRRLGDRWVCPVCSMCWVIESNRYDSLLPFGDYQWFSRPPRPAGWRGAFFGPRPERAITFQPEPCRDDRTRMRALLHHADVLGIPHQFVLDTYDRNPSRDLPYHGAAHGVVVALRAVEAATEAKLGAAEVRAILLAGLFHDAGYVAGDGEPANIARAVRFAEELGLAGTVADLIRATAFPHERPRNDAEAILQDADLLASFEPDAKRFLAGLEKERGIPSDLTFPPESFLNTEAARARLRRTARDI